MTWAHLFEFACARIPRDGGLRSRIEEGLDERKTLAMQGFFGGSGGGI
jgi:hypothetical protein